MSIMSLPTAINNARSFNAPGSDPRQQLQAASEQFEALFLQQILKQMRKAGDVLSADNPMRSRELDTMRDFYDEAMAEHLATSKQTGISDMLVKQLAGTVTPQLTLTAAQQAARSADLPRTHIVSQQPLASTWERGVAAVNQVWQRGSEALGSLVDSLISHESAGDIAAVSTKGARGLMQLMPGTARDMAAKLGLDFSEERLTRDGEYNKTLGVAYLKDMLERYDGHQALAVAAYNAGPGKVDEWLQRNGDPRTGQIGTEAWVQRIPYEETRNYTRSILQDLQQQRLRGEATESLPVPARASLDERLQVGEIVGMAASRTADVSDKPDARTAAFKPAGDVVALDQRVVQLPGQQPLHQSLSAAFAPQIRIEMPAFREPKGSLS
ncbi:MULTISPECIES: lytic transglycosylase domain-containing protein [unclassified Pseudomonas]|uniref:lytic transglycosylase domain-containing protein n=1 Tax=unclassified Pseudomonas TaxID=196821 RepID=UPI002E8248A2|nr:MULTISPECIES: transglycosylase SLT domain-containing protein [unclassified Pseudomonas]